MKYKILYISEHDFDVIVEDGGIASVNDEFGYYNVTYYQSRISPDMQEDEIQEVLHESKCYIKDYTDSATRQEVIADALQWLCVGVTEWEQDNNIFANY